MCNHVLTLSLVFSLALCWPRSCAAPCNSSWYMVKISHTSSVSLRSALRSCAALLQTCIGGCLRLASSGRSRGISPLPTHSCLTLSTNECTGMHSTPRSHNKLQISFPAARCLYSSVREAGWVGRAGYRA
ncbi:hypothetical protein BKA93DRAFT_582282 [Sparassis latifolia]